MPARLVELYRRIPRQERLKLKRRNAVPVEAEFRGDEMVHFHDPRCVLDGEHRGRDRLGRGNFIGDDLVGEIHRDFQDAVDPGLNRHLFNRQFDSDDPLCLAVDPENAPSLRRVYRNTVAGDRFGIGVAAVETEVARRQKPDSRRCGSRHKRIGSDQGFQRFARHHQDQLRRRPENILGNRQIHGDPEFQIGVELADRREDVRRLDFENLAVIQRRVDRSPEVFAVTDQQASDHFHPEVVRLLERNADGVTYFIRPVVTLVNGADIAAVGVVFQHVVLIDVQHVAEDLIDRLGGRRRLRILFGVRFRV